MKSLGQSDVRIAEGDKEKHKFEIVREFVEKIVVHERSEPYKKKNYTQQVDVYFNFVGKV